MPKRPAVFADAGAGDFQAARTIAAMNVAGVVEEYLLVLQCD
jgi:hypothetical protein